MSKHKYNWIDSSDVFSNSFSRMAKHTYIPTIIGLINGVIITFLIAKYFPTDALNLYYFDGFKEAFVSSIQMKKSFILDGEEILTKEGMEYFTQKLFDGIFLIILIFIASFLLTAILSLYIKIRVAVSHSSEILEDQHITGTKILSEKELTQQQVGMQGAIVGNTAKLDEEIETQHTFISGSAGTGKTVVLNQQYVWQKKNRQNGRWIVHDTKGDYIEKFYNPQTDYIFNFSDARSMNFNIFSVIKIIPDIKSIVATIITRPPEEKDEIWTNTARDILEACILYCIKYDKKTNIEIKKLIGLSPEKLAYELKSVEGAEVAYGHLTSSDTQAGNFMSNFRSKVGFFTSMPDNIQGKEINIEEWLDAKDGGQSTIFLLNDTKNKDLNAVRIAVFLDSYIKTFLSMSESKTRCVYFFLDEIGSLNKIPSIVDGLALLRSYGGRFYIGIQEIQRLYSIYGKDLTSTIVNNTATKIILRAQEYETQEFCSKQIGEGKYKSTTITNSSGSEINANREGTSYSSQEKIDRAVLASEIGNMKNNTYYYKNGSYDWTFIEKKFTDSDIYEKTQKAFVPRTDLDISNLFKYETVSEIANTVKQQVENHTEISTEEKQENIPETRIEVASGLGF
jgi:type IV secretory pathway TraG/TraD family ATPase VirD4